MKYLQAHWQHRKPQEQLQTSHVTQLLLLLLIKWHVSTSHVKLNLLI
jgi:hypothetical protein